MASLTFRPALHPLDFEECLLLLRTRDAGHLALPAGDAREPLPVYPVRYALRGEHLVCRVPDVVDAPAWDVAAVLEVDELASPARGGWHVLVVGTAEALSHGHELDALRGLPPVPWQDRTRTLAIRIRPVTIRGHRLDDGSRPADLWLG